MSNKYLTVSALNKYLYYKFDNDLNLRTIYLKAEISNVRLSKGILYFVLKDPESEIDGLMFGQTLSKLKFKPVDGMTVLVTGKVGLYIKRGTYAITVSEMEQVGLGEAYLNFQFLKEKLLKEGLFDEDKKLPIPRFSEKIGVITSGTGDAMHDIFSTIKKRFPLSEIVFYPAIVQGEDAPRSLINAIKLANSENIVNVLIIARGGGTIEDLSCFNDEELARTIYRSNIPTISGVGHEADFTICDFVASRRAPTPTGAAVIATPDKDELISYLNSLENNMTYYYKQNLISKFNEYSNLKNRFTYDSMIKKLNEFDNKVIFYEKQLNLLSPIKLISDNLTKLNYLNNNLETIYNKIIDKNNYYLDNYLDKLIILNPLNLMKKGYSITYKDNKVVSSVKQIDINEEIDVRFQDGKIKAKVLKKD